MTVISTETFSWWGYEFLATPRHGFNVYHPQGYLFAQLPVSDKRTAKIALVNRLRAVAAGFVRTAEDMEDTLDSD